MKFKMIATSACCVSPTRQKHLKLLTRLQAQRGATLIELMVGLTIGLLTITVALGSLMVSRSISGTVSDTSQLQQQSAYVFRVIGQQLRQAGSLYLNLAPQQTTGIATDISERVTLETKTSGFDPAQHTISGMDAPGEGEYKLSMGYRNYTEQLYTYADAESLQRNCLGQQNSGALIQSNFVLEGTELRCAGSDAAQPVAENVAAFEVRYLLQDTTTTPGNPQIKYTDAATVGTKWDRVQGVEVCLVLYGTESIDMPAGSSYTDCDGSTQVDMTTLTGTRAKRLHMAFRNVYQLRSQGRPT